MISEIRKGDHVLDSNGKKVQVMSNLRFANNDQFIKIEKGALGMNMPFNDLIIRKGHPVSHNSETLLIDNLAAQYSKLG